MSDNTQNSKRIVKNTIMLYIRMLFLMFINLYTSRVILNALGIEDYGIYNAVGGFVAMFSIISSSLSAAISRFITFELGRGDKQITNTIFSTAVIIQMLIGAIIVILLLTVGVWFLNTQMTIAADRMYAANWVFVLSAITFLVNIMSVPYNACIIAHEKMQAFAYIGIIEAVGRLMISYLIIVSPIDKLIFYAILLCALSVSIRLMYKWYSNKNFDECKFRWVFDKKTTKEIFGFAGWNFLGSTAGILKEQGVNVLLNIFCGPAVNAARGIAVQVSTAVTQFAQNFITAINPQITKSYANNNHSYMIFLLEEGAKLSYFMLFTLSLPILINTPYILGLWLGEYPEYTVIFVQLILLTSIHDAISTPLVTAMLATGKIRNYQIVVGGIQLTNLPLSYLVLRSGCSPEFVFIVAMLLSIFCLAARVYMLSKMINLSIRNFIKNVYSKILTTSVLSFIIAFSLAIYSGGGLNGLIMSCTVGLVLTITIIYYVGCNKQERKYITTAIKGIKKKILK